MISSIGEVKKIKIFYSFYPGGCMSIKKRCKEPPPLVGVERPYLQKPFMFGTLAGVDKNEAF